MLRSLPGDVVHQARGHDAHPAGNHHEVHPLTTEQADQTGIEGAAIAISPMVQASAGNSQPLRAASGETVRCIHREQHHLSGQVPVA